MPADGTYTGVVDRFEGDQAVVLLEADGETVAERALPSSRLPEDGRQVDAVVSVTVRDGDVTDVAYRAEASERRADRARRRFDALSSRPPSAEESERDEGNDDSDRESE